MEVMNKMTLDRILYIDDNFGNGMTAMTADSRIDFASGVRLIERPLQEYDCIITDMRMEHAESGMEVVEKAMREGRLPYVATGGTYEHGGTFNRVKVFNSDFVETFDKMSKSEERFWREFLTLIDAKEGEGAQRPLRRIKETLGVVPEDQIRMLMAFYRMNYGA